MGFKILGKASEYANGLIYFLAACSLLIMFSLGLCVTSCRNACSICLLTFLSLISGGFFVYFAVDFNTFYPILHEQLCQLSKEEIKAFYDPFVEQMMCSEFCPCGDSDTIAGSYKSLTAE